MFIEKIEIENFKSYGNIKQVIEFTDKGQLIYLTGKNGTGKTSIKHVIELCLFNELSGRNRSSIALIKAANHINDTYNVGLWFKNYKNDIINIIKNKNVNNNKFIINNEDKSKWFNDISNLEREEIIGFSKEIFKKFFSLNMRDFQDFIKIPENDKINFINKLFLIEKLTIYYKDALEKQKAYKLRIEDCIKKIENFDSNIKNLKSNLEFISEINYELEINKLNKENDGLNDKLNILNIEIDIIDKKLIIVNNNRNGINKQKNDFILRKKTINSEIKEFDNKILFYKNGICPYCNSTLETDIHLNTLNDLKKERSKLISNKNKIINEEKEFLLKEIDFNKKSENINNTHDDINTQITNIKDEIKDNLNKIELYNKQKKISKKYDKFKDEIVLIEEEKIKISDFKENLIEKSKYLDILIPILKGDFFRQNITKIFLIELNEFLNYCLEKFELNYQVNINSDFDCIIKERNEVKDPEIISVGEAKIINISISLSYLNMILSKQQSNIIFLDEVFDGIDGDNIYIVLDILKELTRKYNTNVIVIHHSQINYNKFDRIIKTIKENKFSRIEEIQNN
jgi:DNA repair exonuclease SbcCD ATPase subunit